MDFCYYPIVFIKDRFLKVFSMIFLFGLAYAMWGL
jgi:competence protein ComEC